MTEKLLLGVGRRLITPPLGGFLYGYPNPSRSVAVHDDLTVTAAYFKEGETEALLLSFTICTLATDLCDRLSARLESETGVAREGILLHAIHTHSGPSTTDSVGWGSADRTYIEEILIPAACLAAKEAMDDPRPARMAVAVGESLVGINRREIRGGQACLGQNPDGPHERRMTVIGFFAENGAPLLTAVHYGAHPTASGHNAEITRDWPGAVIDALEEETGATALFLQGPEGDAGPRMPSGKTIGEASAEDGVAMGRIAAADALAIYRRLGTPRFVPLTVSRKTLALPLAARPSRQEAEEAIRRNEGAEAGVEAKTLDYYRRVLASYDEGYTEKESLPLEQTLLRLGDLVLVSFPYELFTEIGMAIRNASPFPHTLPLSLTGGRACYFVTEDAIPFGGYEVTMFLLENIQRYPAHIDRTLAELTLGHLELMKIKLDIQE